jgi:membrane associated rhomboid family serine protease
MTMAPVGIRCPDHSGRLRGPAGVARSARRFAYEGTNALLTKILIGANVAVFLAQLATGGSVNGASGTVFVKGALISSGSTFHGLLFFDPSGSLGVAHGEWWRLLTAAFLHASLLHIGMNMLVLWWVGPAMEATLGRGRFLLLYLVSALAGSAGALVLNPTQPTLGASGAIFGIFGAGLVLERQGINVFGGSALTLVILNLALSFAFSNVSIGGHVGGLVGGILATLGFSRFGRGHAVYGRLGLTGVASLAVVGVASVLVAYWKVRGYA